MNKKLLTIYRIILIILALVFLGWLIDKNMVKEGELKITKDFCSDSLFISDLYPEERVGQVEKNNCWQRIFVEPAYFKVNVPRTFERIQLKITYFNPDQDIVQIGLMKKKEHPLDWRFTLKPMENSYLDNLSWFKLEEQGISLWQREKEFNSIYDFVNNLPLSEKILTFFYNFSPEILREREEIEEWELKDSLENKDYLIADYISPKIISNSNKEWKEQTVDFWAGQEHLNGNFYEFMISAPGFNNQRKEILIKNIEVRLKRPPTNWSNLIVDLKDYFLRKFKHE